MEREATGSGQGQDLDKIMSLWWVTQHPPHPVFTKVISEQLEHPSPETKVHS